MILPDVQPPVQLNYAGLEAFAADLHKAALQTDELKQAISGYDFGTWDSAARQSADEYLEAIQTRYADPIAGNYLGVGSVFRTLSTELQALDERQRALNAKWEESRVGIEAQLKSAEREVGLAEENLKQASAADSRKNVLNRAFDVASKGLGNSTSLDRAHGILEGSRSRLNQVQQAASDTGHQYMADRERLLDEIREAYLRAAGNISAVFAETGSGYTDSSVGGVLDLGLDMGRHLRETPGRSALSPGDEVVLQKLLSGDVDRLAVHTIFLPGVGKTLAERAEADPTLQATLEATVERMRDVFNILTQNPEVAAPWSAQREAELPVEQQELLARLRGLEGDVNDLELIVVPQNPEPQPGPQPGLQPEGSGDEGLISTIWDNVTPDGLWNFAVNNPLTETSREIIGYRLDPFTDILDNIRGGNWSDAARDFGLLPGRLLVQVPFQTAGSILRGAGEAQGVLLEAGFDARYALLDGAGGVLSEAAGGVAGASLDLAGGVLGGGREALGGVAGTARELTVGFTGAQVELLRGNVGGALGDVVGGFGGAAVEIGGGIADVRRELLEGAGGAGVELLEGVAGATRENFDTIAELNRIRSESISKLAR